jgi:glycosyltransferase involved in cell wall biosynthesis
MCALRNAVPDSDLRLSLVTSTNLDEEFRDATYTIRDVLPPLRSKDTFATPLHWALSRLAHYRRRDAVLLRLLAESGDVDIVHYQEPPLVAPIHYAQLCRLGIRPVVTVHNLLPHRNLVPGTGWFTDRMSTAGWRRSSALFVHSDGLRNQLLHRLGSSPPPIVTVPHGLWRVPSHSRAATRDRLQAKHLLLFGVLRRNKGIGLILDALSHLPGIQLTLAGEFEEASLRNEIVARLNKESLPVRVIDRFIPEAEVASLFGQATLAVLPYTDFHAQSGVVHLAASYGVPSIVTDVGALGEFVRANRVGLVAPGADAKRFAQAIRLGLEPNTYESLAENCAHLSDSLSWTRAAKLTFDCYEALVGSRASLAAEASASATLTT